MKKVVTYNHAYVGGRTALCSQCKGDPAVLAALPTLGPVYYGAHRGYCDGCEVRLAVTQAQAPAR